MAETVRVQVNKQVWNWALKESQKDEEEILGRFPRINKWINGEEDPTFKQLEKFANYLKIPFGYMFLEHPPENNVMEVEFRTMSNILPEMSKDLKDTIMEMDNKQNWMRDYRKGMGWDKLDIITQFNKNKTDNILDNAYLAKKLLKLEDNWYQAVKGFDEAYNLIRQRLEDAGILVMQNGIVGMNTRRPLNINEFRAFMLYDDIAPLIFINSKDTKAGKIFSLIHEYIHILFEQDDLLLDEDIVDDRENEAYINHITAEILMPKDLILELWDRNENTLDQIYELSNMLKVSRLALAIKLKSMNLIDDKMVEIVRHKSIKDFDSKEKGSSGGDFYRTFNSRISPVFKEAVIVGAEAGEISFTYAFQLLGGIKGKTYDKLKEEVLNYG